MPVRRLPGALRAQDREALRGVLRRSARATTRSREFGLALGVAFQIADDILDCSGSALETGKVAGTDLREGTPTLPLLLAARRDPSCATALLGGPLDGVLVRVAESGALDRSRRLADRYAERARQAVDGHPRAADLAALTYAVVDRQR